MQLDGLSGCKGNQAAYRLPLSVGPNPYQIFITMPQDSQNAIDVVQQQVKNVCRRFSEK